VDETTTVTEHDGKHHGRRSSRPTRQESRADRGEVAASNSILPPHQGLGVQAVHRRLGTRAITPDLMAIAQRTVGNAVVQRLLWHQSVPTQTRPHRTRAPGTDRVAAAVTRAPVREPIPAAHHRPAGTLVQRTPDPPKPGTGDGMFRIERHGYVFFGARSDGIRFLVGVPAAEETTVQAALPAIGQRIAKDNAVIKDPAYQVTTCIITNTSSRLALWKNRPTVLINRVEADTETVAHEMGHAIFYYLEQRAKTKDPDAKPAANFRIAVADIFNRLANTKSVTKKVHTRVDGKIVAEERDHPAGLWIVDPSQWKAGKQPLREHPWDDADEFFGTAKEAYQIDRKALEKTIDRFKKIDPAVEAPMKDLLALLDNLFTKSALPTTALSTQRDGATREAAAIQSLKSIKDPSDVENATAFEVQFLIAKA
jgi:hypothetical protein